MSRFRATVTVEGQRYLIAVIDSRTMGLWDVYKSLEEFYQLYEALARSNQGVMVPPGYSRMSYFPRFLKSVQPDMQAFLNSVLTNPNLSSSEEIFIFLQVYSHLDTETVIKSVLVQEKEMTYPVRFLQKSENFLLACEVDHNPLHRMEQYMKYIGYAGSTMSRITCFGEFGMWEKTLSDTVTCFHYNPQLTVLCIGLDDGDLLFLRIKTEKNSSEYEDFGKTSVHPSPVCGVSSDYSNSKIFSICTSGMLAITSLVDHELFITINLGIQPKNLIHSHDLRTLYFSTKREVFTYEIEVQKERKAFEANFSAFICAMCVSRNGFCIIGGFDGEVNVFNSNFIIIQVYSVIAAVKCIVYNESLRLVAIADGKGNVSIWDCKGECSLKWKAHKNSTALCFEGFQLISAGDENVFKTWTLQNLPTNH